MRTRLIAKLYSGKRLFCLLLELTSGLIINNLSRLRWAVLNLLNTHFVIKPMLIPIFAAFIFEKER